MGWFDFKEKCPMCNGSGSTSIEYLNSAHLGRNFGTHRKYHTCNTCGGKGKVRMTTCHRCRGSGEDPYNRESGGFWGTKKADCIDCRGRGKVPNP